MKRITKKKVKLSIEPYGMSFTVFTDFDTIILYLRKNYLNHTKKFEEDISQAQGYCIEFFNQKGDTDLILFLPKKYDDLTVAHETIHLTWAVFKHTCTNMDANNDETQAYLQGYLMKQIKEKVYGIK